MNQSLQNIKQDSSYDVIIIGAGMVGASAALCFAQTEKSVLLIDAFELSSPKGIYTPSYDARSTALSWGSKDIFEQMGIWDQLKQHVQAINTVHVSQKGRFGTTRMDASELQHDALGYVIPNQWLGQCLLSAIKLDNITLCSPAKVVNIKSDQHGKSLTLKDQDVTCLVNTPLLVVADGNNSETSKLLGIEHSVEPYQQHALIANITTELPNNGVAYERFTKQGPLALLPLSDKVSALVWTHDNQDIEHTMSLSDEAFCHKLQSQFGDRLGSIIKVGKRDTYPLKLVRAQEQFRPGVVLLGNAAHSLHPVAGQGFNLALRGVASLISCLQENQQQAALNAFYTQQKLDQDRTIHMSDQLVKVFGHDSALLAIARDFGLIGLNNISIFKTLFAKTAMGIIGTRNDIGSNKRTPKHA